MDQEQKRFYILVGIAVVTVLVFTLGFIFLTKEDPNLPDEPTTMTITKQDQAEIKELTEDFMKANGTWGVRPKAFTKESFGDGRYLVETNSPGVEKFFDSRLSTYEKLKEKFLAPNGTVWYSANITVEWTDEQTRGDLSNFVAKTVSPNVPSKGSTISISGVEYPAITVKVDYTGQYFQRTASGSDVNWKGDYEVFTKKFNDSGKVVVVKIEGEWRVYDVKDFSYPFLFATWRTPNQDYLQQVIDAEYVETLETNIITDQVETPAEPPASNTTTPTVGSTVPGEQPNNSDEPVSSDDSPTPTTGETSFQPD